MLVVATPPASPQAARSAASSTCGFHRTPNDPEGALSRYGHCGDSFILIRVDWRSGRHHAECVSPWASRPFFRAGDGDVVANAYYVPTPPRLLVVDGRTMCSLTQPDV
ncbi:DUF6355 family natural product biosynthesis protein [Actinosynnema sp. NPDC050436]|uniref:DUF6355 family natural product biosynthesis protein n=1 Tax=Actinosynnema sp. NPDC050436 TaxID=3155659 RepID=UPI0033DAC487